MSDVVPAELRAEQILISRHVAQSDAGQDFAHASAVERRRVDEVQAALQRDANAVERLVELHAPKFLAQRRGSEAEDRQIQAGAAQRSSLHDVRPR